LASFWTTAVGRAITGAGQSVVGALVPVPVVREIAQSALDLPALTEQERMARRAAAARQDLAVRAPTGGALIPTRSSLTTALARGGISAAPGPAFPRPRLPPPAGGFGGVGQAVGDWVGGMMARRVVSSFGDRSRAPARATTMNGNGALKRALRGGLTRSEASRLGIGAQWAWPQPVARFGPQGEAYYYKRRRGINVTNAKALSRALRRLEGFSRLAKRYLKISNPKAKIGGFKMKGTKRR